MSTNPFNLPNFAALGDSGNNPLLRSMDMMSQAWKNMATGGSAEMGAAMMGQLDPEELDRRIRDMRAVESWLQLNLSMLSATIQGMEIQRSTLNTLHELARSSGKNNPFETLLAAQAAAAQTRPAASTESKPAAPEKPQPSTASMQASAVAEEAAEAMAEAGTAAKGWWNMLQQQFESLASASLKQAEAFHSTAAQAVSADSTLGARQSPFSGVGKAASAVQATTSPEPARKTVAKKVPAKKAAAKKTATKSATKSAAVKSASHSPK